MSTLDELRRTLETHSRELPLSEPRTVAVHRRIQRIRRQRAAAGATVVIAVAVVGALTVQATTSPSDQVSTSSHLRYAAGGRLAAVMDIDGSRAVSATSRITPTSGSLILLTQHCGNGDTGNVAVEFFLDGKDIGDGTCGGSLAPQVVAGRPVTVEFRLRYGLEDPPRPVTDSERRQLAHVREQGGVYLPVPRSEYVFPPRPAHLESLKSVGNPGTELSQAGSGTRSTPVDLTRGLKLEIDAVEPGVVTAEIDGKVVGTASTWAYGVQTAILDQTSEDLGRLGIHGAEGQLTLHASGFADASGAWKAELGSPVAGAPRPPGAVSP